MISVVDAVFFDLDGTLIDSEALALRSSAAVFARHGLPFDRGLMHQMIGKDERSAIAFLAKAFPQVDAEVLQDDLQRSFYQEAETGVALKPGVHALLAQLPYPKALVTSSGRRGALRKLQLTGLHEAFSVIVTLDEVARPKPAPDPYLLAAQLMQVVPARVVVFEDSEVGAEAAFRAGMHVVQVKDVMPPSGRFAHHICDDLMTGAQMAGLIC